MRSEKYGAQIYSEKYFKNIEKTQHLIARFYVLRNKNNVGPEWFIHFFG